MPGSALPACADRMPRWSLSPGCSEAGSGAGRGRMWVGGGIREHGPDRGSSDPWLSKLAACTVLHLRPGEQGQSLPRAAQVLGLRRHLSQGRKTCGPPTTLDTSLGYRLPQSQPSSHSPWLGGGQGALWGPLPRQGRQRTLYHPCCPAEPLLSGAPHCFLVIECASPCLGLLSGTPWCPLCETRWAGELLEHRHRGLAARPQPAVRACGNGHWKDQTSSVEVFF